MYALSDFQDKKTIIIDKDIYMHNNSNKLRFLLAHEIGHLILHNALLDIFRFDNVNFWIEFHRSADQQQYEYLEGHANEFAGRLLVPYERLLQEVKQALKRVPAQMTMNIEEIIPFLAPSICKVFEVSDQVLEVRLSRENIINNLK